MKSYLFRSRLAHVGVILSNFSIVAVLFGFTAFLSGLFAFLVPFMMFFFWGAAVVFSLGLLLLSPEFMAIAYNISDFMNNTGLAVGWLLPAGPIACGLGIAFGALSIVFLAFEPSVKKHTWRIAFGVIVLVFSVLILAGIVLGALKY